MRVEAIRLRFVSPLHVGDGLLERTAGLPPADTLFGGLCAAVLEAYGEVGLRAWLDRFQREPPFWLSSVFPAFGPERFFPWPRRLARQLDGGMGWPKGLEYVSQAIFEALCRQDRRALAALSALWRPVQEGRMLAVGDCPEWVWTESARPRVSLDRRTAGASLYSCRRLAFAEGAEGFILVRDRNPHEEWGGRLVGLLRVLGSRGLGGERSAGHGQFELTAIEPLELAVPAHGPLCVLLSPYVPRPEEAQSLEGWFALRRRQAWVGIPGQGRLRQRAYRQIVEGSVLVDRGERGGLVETTPPGLQGGRVWRYGWAFKVPAGGPGDAVAP